MNKELDIPAVVAQARQVTWDKEATYRHIEQAMGRVYGLNPDTTASADMMVAELDLLHHRTAEAKASPHSLWKTFRTMLDQRFEDMGHDGPDGAKGYLSEPAEMLAHAFEMRLSQDTLIGDRFAGKTTLRYPMKEEVAAQDRHWKSFFKTIAQDWQALPALAPAVPAVRLAASLKGQLKACGLTQSSPSPRPGGGVPEPLPLAARRRLT